MQNTDQPHRNPHNMQNTDQPHRNPHNMQNTDRANHKHCNRIWYHLHNEGIVPPAYHPVHPMSPQGVFPHNQPTPAEWCLNQPDGDVLSFRTAEGLLRWAVPFVKAKLGAKFKVENFEAFVREVTNSVHNEALTLGHQLDFQEQVGSLARREPVGTNLWQFVAALPGSLDGQLLFWERFAAFEGHPYHPGAKCKVGVPTDQVLAYSPEFVSVDDPVKIPVLAVHRSLLVFSVALPGAAYSNDESWDALEASPVSELWEEVFGQECGEATSIRDYVRFPVHPFNIAKMQKLFAEFFAAGLVLYNPDVALDCVPTLSFRTLVPLEVCTENAARGMHIKLPVPVQATSLVRYVSPVESNDSPILSMILRKLLHSNGNFGGTMRVMQENVGVYFDYHKHAKFRYEDGRYFSMLIRDAIVSTLPNTTEAVFVLPLAALFGEDFLMKSRVPTAVSLMRDVAGVETREQAVAYFANYCRLVLKGQFGVWLDYGIVLEAHQQNCVLAFDGKGRLVETIHRDLCGGLCIHEAVLLSGGVVSAEDMRMIHERQDYIFEDGEDGLYDYMVGAFEHTVLKSHLIPLAKLIGHYFDDSDDTSLQQQLLHDVVSAEVLRLLDSHPRQHEPLFHVHVHETKKRLLRKTSQFKCLFSMRCLGSKDEFYNQVPNPLVRVSQGTGDHPRAPKTACSWHQASSCFAYGS